EFQFAFQRHRSVGFMQETGERKEMRKYHFCYRPGRSSRSIYHEYPFCTRIFHINIVHTDTTAAYNFQAWTGINQFFSYLGCTAYQQNIDLMLINERN